MMLPFLIESALRSAGVAIVVWIAIRLFRSRASQSLSLIWSAVLLSSVSMPFFMLAMQKVLESVPMRTVAWMPAGPAPVFLRPLAQASFRESTSLDGLDGIDGPAGIDAGDGLTAFGFFYVAVTALGLARLAVGTLRGHLFRRAATPLKEAWTSGWDVRVSASLSVPVTFGRTILLPFDWSQWSAYKRRAVLFHEQAHVSRWDFHMHWIARIHRAVFWFSPMAWWLQRELLRLAENACDDEALRKMDDRFSYASTLIEFAGTGSKERIMGVSMARGTTVQQRVERILRETQSAPRVPFRRRVLLVAGISPLIVFASGSWLVSAEFESRLATPPAPLVLPQQAPPSPPPAAQSAVVPVQATRPTAAPGTRTTALAGWIEQEVPDISTPDELVAFRALKAVEEREQFIAQFWLHRDPTPGTRENEYRDEYFRRIAQANQRYSSELLRGYQTDRGRVFIKFGEPDGVETHAQGVTYPDGQGGRTDTFPFERWRYRFIEGIGRNVELDFVDTARNGNYRLTVDPAARGQLLNDQ